MELSVKKNMAGEASSSVIALAGEATVAELEKLKAVLLASLGECKELLLDLEAITAADPALLQLIHAASSSALRSGIRFSLAGEFSAAFSETAVAAGFLPINND